MSNEQQPQNINFAMHSVYIKDSSFEAPNTPSIFSKTWIPKMNFDIEMSKNAVQKDVYEVILKISVEITVVNDEKDLENTEVKGEMAFIAEVMQAGIFEISNVASDEQLDFILGTTAPTILFPYVREAISNMVAKGGFPQLLLPPINFEDMYRQHLIEKANNAKAEADVVIQ